MVLEIKTTMDINYDLEEWDSELDGSYTKYKNKKWVSVDSLLKDIKVIKKLVKKHRLEHAGLDWFEARLNGMIVDFEEDE